MIDVDRTLSVLGVDVSTLTHGSHKKVFRVCEECGGYSSVEYHAALKYHLCHPCSMRTPEKLRKQSENKKGNTNCVGRELSEETCRKISKAHEGMKATEETKHKMSEARMGNTNCVGNKASAETKRKMSEARMGENNSNWKGGTTSKRHSFYTSNDYRSWRRSVFERDHFTCCKCNQHGSRLNAHHIFPLALYPQYGLTIRNGITLCEDCHDKIRNHELDFISEFLGMIFEKRQQEMS